MWRTASGVISAQGRHQPCGSATQLGLGLRRNDQVKAGDADQHTGHQLAEDRGQLQPHHHLGDGPRRDEDHQEAADLQQRFGRFELVGAELQQQRWERRHREARKVCGFIGSMTHRPGAFCDDSLRLGGDRAPHGREAFIAPILHGFLAFGLGIVIHKITGFSIGGAVVLAVIAASSSDISGPPTLRAGIPSANPSAYIGASTAIGTPVAIAICIPLFIGIAEMMLGMM